MWRYRLFPICCLDTNTTYTREIQYVHVHDRAESIYKQNDIVRFASNAYNAQVIVIRLTLTTNH